MAKILRMNVVHTNSSIVEEFVQGDAGHGHVSKKSRSFNMLKIVKNLYLRQKARPHQPFLKVI